VAGIIERKILEVQKMTLDEAIKHAKEVADKKEREKQKWETLLEIDCNYRAIITEKVSCELCAEEHKQLAEWLTDYKRLLEQQPSDDTISRQAVLDQTYLWSKDEFLRVTNPFDYLRKRINSLSPVKNTINKIREIVNEWKSDTWTDNLSYECMIKIAELVEPQERTKE
jgi:hypothetical protein